MRVLVTGGCGFIGSAVIRHGIRELGATILNIDKLTYAATREALGAVEDSQRYHFMQADICDAEALEMAFTDFAPDAVMHLAAESHVDRSIDGPAAFIQTNLVGTYHLLETARRYWQGNGQKLGNRFRFHHISTDEVFGSLDCVTPGFTENTPYQPRSPYSASKAGSDHLARAWGETYGLPVLVTNCSNNYGPWQFPEKLIPLMIIKARRQEALPVYGEGSNVRDWLYVEDHARALWEIVARGRPGETYNIGGEAERQNIEVVRAICSTLDARFPSHAPHERLIQFVSDRPGHDLRYAIDARKLHAELGWRPSVDFETGLAKTVDWYLDHEGWWRSISAKSYDGSRLGVSVYPKDEIILAEDREQCVSL